MIGPATNTVTILRGTTTDAYGDTIDTDHTFKTGVLVTIYESGKRTSKPVEGRVGTVRDYAGRAHAHDGVAVNDRLRDEKTGEVYLVVEASTLPNPTGPMFTRLKLQRDMAG